MSNKIDSNVYSKLVNSGYLHSNRINFLKITDAKSRMTELKKNVETNKIIEQLRQLSRISKIAEDIFYKDMLVNNAQEFEQKYLLVDDLSQKESLEQIAFRIINSEKFLDLLGNFIDYNKFIEILFGKNQTNITNIQDKKALGAVLVDNIVEKNLLEVFNKSLGRKENAKFKIKSSSNKSIQKFIKIKISEYGEDVFNQTAINKALEYFEVNLRKEINKKPKGTFIIKKNQDINKEIEKMKEKLKDQLIKSFLAGNLTSQSGKIGALLEISVEVIGLGRNIGNDIDSSGKKTGSDLEITGASGTIYKIQLKNSFKTYGFSTIKLQDSIKLNTFLNKIDPSQKNEIGYLLANILYLKNYGLNEKGKSSQLKLNTISTTRDYLKTLLNEIIYTFLGQELQGVAEEAVQNNISNIGNLFFIYQGRYLIPISSFLESAIKMVTSKDTNNTLGSLKTPALEEINPSGGFSNAYARALQDKKRQVIKKYSSKKYSYPKELISIGNSAYVALLENTIITGLMYTTNINNIRKFVLENR